MFCLYTFRFGEAAYLILPGIKLLKYCPDRYKTQEMCHKVADACLPALKFVRDWFVTKK